MESIRLSIIIPAFHSAKTLSDTLNSIIGQNFRPMECWIIDGLSSDGTVEIVKKYSSDHNFIKFISEPDQGIYDAMNKGIRLAKGDYLYFMGSDDVFYNNNVLTELFSRPCFGQYDFIYGDIVFKYSRIRQGEEKNYLKLIKNLENINHQSIFYSRRIFTVIGNYDLRFPIYADFNFNIKCFKDNLILKKYVAIPVCIYNEKGASFFHRSRDRYIETVHELYVTQYEDPVALYDTVKYLEARIAKLLDSKEYILGKKIGDIVRRIKRIMHFKMSKKDSLT